MHKYKYVDSCILYKALNISVGEQGQNTFQINGHRKNLSNADCITKIENVRLTEHEKTR